MNAQTPASNAAYSASRVLFKIGILLVQFVWILFAVELALRSMAASEILEPMDIVKTCMGLGLTAILSMAGLTIRGGVVTASLFGLVGACACFSYVWLFLGDAQLSAAYVQGHLASLW